MGRDYISGNLVGPPGYELDRPRHTVRIYIHWNIPVDSNGSASLLLTTQHKVQA